MADSLDQYFIYYPLALLIVAATIGAIFEVQWLKRHFAYIIAFGWLVFVVKTFVYYSTGTDFIVFWRAGQAILRGGNPYQDLLVVNPPTALSVYVLMGLFPYPMSLFIWTILSAIGAAVLVFLAYRMLQTEEKPNFFKLPSLMIQGLSVIIALSLPSHFSHRLGQFTFLITLCLILAVYAHARGKQILAGIAYAFATIKVNTALPFLMLFWGRRSLPTWLSLGASIFILSIVIPTPFRLLDWMSMNLSNIRSLSQPGGINDFSLQGPFYHNLIGLDSLFYHLGIDNRNLVQVLQFAVLALLGGWIFREGIWKRRWSRGATCAIVALYAMIFMYHRIQDGVILAIPLVYVVTQLQSVTGRSRQFFVGSLFTILGGLYWHPKFNTVIVGLVDRWQISFLSRLASAIFLPLHTWLVLASLFFISVGYVANLRSHQSYISQSSPSSTPAKNWDNPKRTIPKFKGY